MQFTSLLLAAAALTTSVFAQTTGFAVMTEPAKDEEIKAGSQFQVVWQKGSQPETDTYTLTLLQGATPNSLQLGQVIAAGVKNTGSYTWSVPSDLDFQTFGIKITLDSNPATFQYSFPFHITGASSGSSSTGSSTGSSSSGSSSTESSSAIISVASTESATSVSASSTVTAMTTSIAAPTTTATTLVTVCTKCAASSAMANATTTTVVAPTSAPAGSNSTTTSVASSPSASSSSVAANGAIAKAATGGLTLLGGMVLAFAL